MGCGASKDPKIGVADSTKPLNSSRQNPNASKSNTNRNGFKQVDLKNSQNTYDPYNPSSLSDSKKQPLAFVIQFDENKKNGNLNRPPPGRLRLEPLKHDPKSTQRQLDEKMRAAERNREQILASRVRSAKRPSTNNRENDYDNRDEDKNDLYYQDPNNFNIKTFNNKLKSESNGMQKNENDEEKRNRLLKARRITRENNYNNDYDDDEVEHDKTYNRDDDYYNDKRRYK